MAANLLIVDDDELLREVVRDVLEDGGYSIDIAEDGMVAWEKIDSDPSRFDLMLLDKQMPRLGGIALLKRMKSDSRFKDLPVVMLTSDSQQEDVIEGLAEGAHYYLTKPSTADVLKLVIKNALDEFRQRRELRALIGRHANNLNLLRRAEFCCRTLSDARDLALLLADASLNPARTVVGYSELLINAVEHGNLGIGYDEKTWLNAEGTWTEEVARRLQLPEFTQKSVDVSFERSGSEIRILVRDAGKGFDWQVYMEFSPDRAFDNHGRGIAMAKCLSFDRIEYRGCGNEVLAILNI